MDSKLNIDGKISADAMHQGASNIASNVTNAASPLFKDQKRVIKKMFVMDTSKLKSLGIESTIKNAMSKLERGKTKKPNQPKTLVNGEPIIASSNPMETVIKTEFEPNIVATQSTDTIIKQHVYRIQLSPATEQVHLQPMSTPPTTPKFVNLTRSPAVSKTNAVIQSMKLITPQVPATINIVRSASAPVNSIHGIQPLIRTATSTSPTIKPQQNVPIQANCSSNKTVQSETINSTVIKTESASDGKKIKILSDVSLNDAKAKLLEIDKLPSKNLKLTNVIKGTDKSPSMPTVQSNVNSNVNPELTTRSRPPVTTTKAEIVETMNPKFTNATQRSEESPSRSTFSVNHQPDAAHSVSTTSKPLQSGIKLTSSVNLKATDGTNKNPIKSIFYVSNCTNQPVTSSSSSATHPNIENRPNATKYVKIPHKVLHFPNTTEGCTLKSQFPRLPVKTSSYATFKPSTTGSDNISTRNVIFTNASKPTVYFTSTATKPATPMYSPSVAKKTDSDDVKYADTNSTHYKSHHKPTKEYPMQTPFHKNVRQTTTSTCSTSAATEVSTKKLVTTDENIEIIIPSKQKYLSKKDKSGLYERTPINDATKPFQDVLWATNNPRTYARHNVKRLLSDKIIKKTNLQVGSQTTEASVPVDTEKNPTKLDERGDDVQTSEVPVHVQSDERPTKSDVKGDDTTFAVQVDTSIVECESKTGNVNSILTASEPICSSSTSSVSSVKLVDDIFQVTDATKPSVAVEINNFHGFSNDEVDASTSVMSQIKDILSRKRKMKASTVENVNEIKIGDCDNLILNYETGVLEDLTKKHRPPTAESDIKIDKNLGQTNPIFVQTPIKPISPAETLEEKSKVRLDSATCDDAPVPSKVPVIEDADDEISDIDLVHRSKAKCTGNLQTPTVKNRRAILKSVELHRNAFIPATTDDESELSLCVRPPRPKLKKSRQKQTVEQLKIQQSAHVSLLKRFTQTDADCANFNDESLLYFIDGVEERIKVLEDQVECCFQPQNRDSAELEQIESACINPISDEVESVKPSEIVTESNAIVRPSESFSSVNHSQIRAEPQPNEPISDTPLNNAEIADSEEGQSTIHEVKIEEDTFLVTEYNNRLDKINHLPLNVKQEKDTSPQPQCSVERSRNMKHTRTTLRKKRKRKSLVEMLAQHVDQDTLKSVILAHAKQKCDLSSSPDSDSDNDDRSDEANDVVNKIFRTVCTIDLCDDDDMTLHEDVLQYMNETEENEMGVVQDSVCVTPTNADDMPASNASHELPDQTKRLKIPDDNPGTSNGKSETCSTVAHVNTIGENSIANACEEVIDSLGEDIILHSAKECDDAYLNVPVKNLSQTDSCMGKTSSSSLANDFVMEPAIVSEIIDAAVDDNYTPPTIDVISKLADDRRDSFTKESDEAIDTSITAKLDDTLKEPESVIDVEVKAGVPICDNLKSEGTLHGTSIIKESEEVLTNFPMDSTSNLKHMPNTFVTKQPQLKLRPFDEISSRSKRKREDDELTIESSTGKKMSFEENLAEADSMISNKSEGKSKRKVKAAKSKRIDSKGRKLSDKSVTTENEKSSEPTEPPPSNEKANFSSVSVNDDSAAGSIKIKIKIGKDAGAPKTPISSSTNETLNEVLKTTRSRKRKSQVSEAPVITTPTQSETTRKRPIFDNFDAPEILTTKRTRKSKSYVENAIQNEAVPVKTPVPNQRTSRRKLNNAKGAVEDVPPKADSNIEKVNDDQHEIPFTEMVETVTEPKVQENKAPILTTPKSGRGIRPPVLAPLNIAAKYVCGNCKEEVIAKNWTKHIKTHYGLTWRVDVDPPIDMDNIHTMSSKVLNFMKKANIRILKCQQCNVEKKSALGYLSHLEVCGLTPEEIKSKLVKCEYCPSMIRTCSMKIHLTFCAGLKRVIQKENESTTKEDENLEECFNEAGRAVRRSAQKARSSFKDLGKPPEAKLEDYVESVQKISGKQQRKWRQLLKEDKSIECVRNGCEFTTDDMVAMTNHFNTCVLVDGETFYCNRCDHGPDTRVAVEEHIKANHSLGVIESIDDKDFSDSDAEAELDEESSESEGESGDEEISEKGDEECNYDDDDDGWNSKGHKKKKIRDWGQSEILLNSCLDRKVLNEHSQLLKTYSGGSYFEPTLEWTYDFRDQHFSSEALLPFATPNTFSVLNSTLFDLYLPRITMSNKFFVKDVRKYKKRFGSTEVNKSDDWKSLKRFEATKDNCSIVMFTGGPVLSMAWLPVPDDHLSQLLAVCCRNDAHDDILLNDTKPAKCLIQIWNFDKLKNNQLSLAQTPNLLYCIAYDHGPVIQMEFCPSGGFTDDRLGLLAVTSYDGHVDILALPKNFTCDNSTIESLVFTIEPSLTLCCEIDEPLGVLLTKLTWSQSKGHTKLAGGYSNGLVAIWNLKNLETPFNCRKVNGTPTLLPTDLFYAGNKTIRLLEFHHDEKKEARWLIAGSHDRKVKFFDTHNVYIEISTTVAHSRIVAGCWPMHWSSFLCGIDNAYSLKVSGIVVKQPLDIGCRTATFYSIIGSTCDISFNNWLNTYAFVTSYGDIHVGYVRQMISGFCETRRQRSILGYTDAVNTHRSESTEVDGISASDEQQPSTSSACTLERNEEILYPSADGIIFCDFQNPLPAVTSPSYDKIEGPPMNTYNMVKVNRILFNPNVSAYKLYALGYEAGFVRINQLMPK